MDWLSDNYVWLTAAIAGAFILVALAIMLVAGLRLWRAGKAAVATTGAAGETLARQVDVLTAAVDALPDRQAELQSALVDLRARAGTLTVLGATAAQLLSSVRFPFKYRMR